MCSSVGSFGYLRYTDTTSDTKNALLVRFTGSDVHRAFRHECLEIEEAASHPLAAFYVEVATTVKSRCVTVRLAMRLPGFSHLQFSLTYGCPVVRRSQLTCYQAR